MSGYPKLDFFYIYALSDPRTHYTYYNGKTNEDPKQKLSRTMREAKVARKRGKVTRERDIRTLDILDAGLKPQLTILFKIAEGDSHTQWEPFFMSLLRIGGIDLKNMTEGGKRDSTGIPRPEGMGEKIRETQLGKEQTLAHKEAVEEGKKSSRKSRDDE